MNIVVTGCAGFIGSNLTRKLIELGHDVTGIDNLAHGSLQNLNTLLKNRKFCFEEVDILDASKLEKKMKKPDLVFHLAAGKIPRYTDALDTLIVNGLGSKNVFEAAAKNSSRVIAASTSDVYGKNPTLPFSETSDLVVGGPSVKRWSYAVSKMYEEQLLFALSDRFEMPATLIRFFGAYGIYQSRDWLGGPVPVFIEKTIKNEEIEIHGDGLQTRSFTFIDDHVNGLVALAEDRREGKYVYNFGTDHEITILELAKTIWELIRPGTNPKLKLIPYNTFGKYEDVMRRVPDTSLVQQDFGLTFNTPLIEGLRRTISWQKAFYL